jgi:ABC-type transport system involved in multi-copper enzyme maturation permease subunit
LNPIVARAFWTSLRPKVLLGLLGAGLLVLASAPGLAPALDSMPGLRVPPLYLGLCRAELTALLVVVTITAAAAIASERQEKTWDALALSALSNTELVLGKAASVLPPAALLFSLLVPVHLAYGIAHGASWDIILRVQVVFLGAAVGAAGLSLLCSAACGHVLHAVGFAAAAIVLGWFAALDGLAYAWPGIRFAAAGHPFRLLDDLAKSAASAEVAWVRVLGFLLAAGIGASLAFLAAIRVARVSIAGTVLVLPGLLRLRPGKSEPIWDDPVYWRECRSRGARRVVRIGGLLLLGLAVVCTVMQRDSARSGFWAQLLDLAPNYSNLLIHVGTLMLCLRASVAIVDERRRGMLAPLALAGISPAHLVWSKLKGALRPAIPLSGMILILWVGHTGMFIGRFVDSRLWLDAMGVFAAVAAGYFLAVSLGLLASSLAPSLRVALLVGVALLVAWDNAGRLVPDVLRLACPGISSDTTLWLFNIIGGGPGSHLAQLAGHVARVKYIYPPTWAAGWVAVTTLAGVAAWTAAVFRMSREHGRPAGRPAPTRPEPA